MRSTYSPNQRTFFEVAAHSQATFFELKKIFLQNFFQEISNYWRKRISEEKFCWHNSQWLEMVKQATTNEQLNNSEYDKLFEDEYILPSGLVLDSEELLRDSEFLNSVVAPIQRR